MDEETTGQAAAPEAPPGDTGAVVATADPPSFEADYVAELSAADGDIDAMLEAARKAVMAEADAVEETPADPPSGGTTAAAADVPVSDAAAPPPAEKTAEPDYAAIAAELAQRGYKVEAPAPPPDPYQQLIGELTSERGSDEQYAEARQQALAYVPAEPAAYDADSVSRHEAAIKQRNEAAARLQGYDQARRITDQAIRFGRDRALGQLGAAFAALPETYSLPAEHARRVTEPQSPTDAVAAIVETVTERINADWQAKYAALQTRMEGEVARARTGRLVGDVRAMGRAPQPATAPGGKPASPFSDLFASDGMPDDAMIERAKRGELTGLDLSRG